MGKGVGKVIRLASWELRPILQVAHGGCRRRRMQKQATQGGCVELGPSIIRDRSLYVHGEGQGKRPCPSAECWGLGSRLGGGDWHCQIQVWLRLVWRGEYGLGLGLGWQRSRPQV